MKTLGISKGTSRRICGLAATLVIAGSANGQFTSHSPQFPPIGGIFTSAVFPPPTWSFDTTPILIKNFEFEVLFGGAMPPPLSSSVNSFFDIFYKFEISFDSGNSFHPVQQQTQAEARMTTTVEPPPDFVLDTELLALNLQSVLPIPFALRESPTRASLGRARIGWNGTEWVHDSFFDVFVEISVDGHQWFPSTESGRIILVPEPASVLALGTGLLALALRRRRGRA